MGEVSCPNCGNPNLDVDAQNNVVYCSKCGFAVQVDPQSGNVTPITPGQGAGPVAAAPAGGGMAVGHKTILGMEPFVFLSVALLIVLILALVMNFEYMTTLIAVVVVFLAYWFLKR